MTPRLLDARRHRVKKSPGQPMSNIYNTSGGYRKLRAFNFATIIHLGTISFCKRYLSWKDDPLGKMLGQMVGASRSGKQNMIESSEAERILTTENTEVTERKCHVERSRDISTRV